MMMFFNAREKSKQNALKFFVDSKCFPQIINTLQNRARSFNIELVVSDFLTMNLDDAFFGALLQYPNADGEITDYANFITNAKKHGIFVSMVTDLMALTLIKPPGEMGADCALGNSQRFGVPLNFGGPHAAFFATTENFKRFLPGRVIGVSVDARGNKALRMALQTREQHIKRERATSNICTAQALLAIMSSMYAVYHGPEGIKDIATKIHEYTCFLKQELEKLNYKVINKLFFDTITIQTDIDSIKPIADKYKVNFRYNHSQSLSISLDETTNKKDLETIIKIFAEAKNVSATFEYKKTNYIEQSLFKRTSNFLTHPVFNSYHTETEMMRYIKSLENKDISLVHSMISLGSCTMKLNAASELIPLSWPEFTDIHPYVPSEQVPGYMQIIEELSQYLCEITGFSGITFQPNSGAQGEYTGLLLIRAYHQDRNEQHRNVILIPSSAHGTNPASAAMAGFKIVVVKCDANGNVDVDDLKQKAEQHKNELAGLMITYPSTHGVFEERIKEITDIIHKNGGLVYMDGANMNAQVGLTNPALIGADVCHLNLHKTFAIPHGGGGPGMGPVLVNDKLKPYLPKHPLDNDETGKNIYPVSAAHYGSALILLITYGYIRMLGPDGLTNATKIAILNANYLKDVLKDYYKILYTNHNGRCAHEFILDCSTFKLQSDVEVVDIAKRLMDFGYHAPTVAFPVPNTLMIEPTESESKHELDKFADAMITIKQEIEDIIAGKYDKKNNPLKNAPHTADMTVSDDWNYPYSREKAAFPRPWVKQNKIWPAVARIDNAYGDRNLICTCPPVSEYEMV
ncbi:MAG: glycine dehydrogenase (decarboxylating) [Bacteroidia bacterium]|nr:MAG: glycine dehydrogenase (decarboxylating) [Bacteroidia bacterium]